MDLDFWPIDGSAQRKTTSANSARLTYVAKFRDTIYVLHVFTKKSQRTSKTDIDIAKKRYQEARDG